MLLMERFIPVGGNQLYYEYINKKVYGYAMLFIFQYKSNRFKIDKIVPKILIVPTITLRAL